MVSTGSQPGLNWSQLVSIGLNWSQLLVSIGSVLAAFSRFTWRPNLNSTVIPSDICETQKFSIEKSSFGFFQQFSPKSFFGLDSSLTLLENKM